MARKPLIPPSRLLLLLISLVSSCRAVTTGTFKLEEATVDDIHQAFQRGILTSKALVTLYLNRIQSLNPTLRAVIEVNPDALFQAAAEDAKRVWRGGITTGLQGIPVLLKDNIATKDRLNTTAGSLALLGSVVPRDAGVVRRLRRAGAVILGKASLSEWAYMRSYGAPSGWCARSGQGKNPYNLSADPCGSSSGSAIAAAANMAAVTLGTETDGSILCPSSANAIVGIKPTVGLTSRAGVIPISPRQDSVGPICRTVSDAVWVLDAIVGCDPKDAATAKAFKFVPRGGYRQFLNPDGLRGKRLGILRSLFSKYYPINSTVGASFEGHIQLLRTKGAVVIDNLEIANASVISAGEAEEVALEAEFKVALNQYLGELVSSPVRTLADVIAFNNRNRVTEKIDEYGQGVFLSSENTTGIHTQAVRTAVKQLRRLSRDGLEKLMRSRRLDAVVGPGSWFSSLLGIGGYPGITVPAAYDRYGSPVGISFGGLRGSEPQLIEVAYAFEQATKIRRPPPSSSHTR